MRDGDVDRVAHLLMALADREAAKRDAAEALRTLATSEKEIHSTDNRWFSVRIMPYRRLNDVIDGVVITLVDISASKELETSLRADAKA